MKEVILSAKAVCKSYPGKGEEALILNHIDVDLYKSDFTVIMGPSGAGKSTLLYALSGMDGITSGSVWYQEQDIHRFTERQMAALRAKEFGFVFQQTHLVSNLTLYENVIVAGFVAGGRDTEREAYALLARMHVEHAKDRLPHQVSGGEAQRAAIAGAMIHHPGILFADEPTGALNKRNSEEVLDILTELNREGQSILMVTHDLRAALRANRLLYLEDGKILDALTLPTYEQERRREREASVNQWLTSLSW